MRDIFDTHVHCRGSEHSSDDIVRAMDSNGIRHQCMIAPGVSGALKERLQKGRIRPDEYRRMRAEMWGENGREANDYVVRLAKEKPDRISALCFVDQLHADAPAEVERSIDAGCIGVKLFNINHYPWDERCFPVYDKCDDLGVPILFHAGILGDGRNSRFHRPAEYEIVKMWPNLKVLLAHIAWPWTDEAIATAGMGPRFEKKSQIYIDLTPGAPLAWREEAEKKALEYLPAEIILFGTDNSSVSEYGGRVLRQQDYIFDKLNVSEDVRRKVYWDNAAEFWGVKA